MSEGAVMLEDAMAQLGVVGASLVMILAMIIILWRYVAKPSLEAFQKISADSREASVNIANAARSNEAAAERNITAARVNEEIAKRMQSMLEKLIEGRS